MCLWLWSLPCTDCQCGCELLGVNSIPSGGSASSRGRWMREKERAPWGLRLNDFTVEGTHLDCLRMSLLHRQKPIFYNCNKLFDFPLIRWQLFWWWSSRCAKNVSVPASNMWRLCDFLFHYESKLNVLTNFSTFPWDKETIERHFSPCCAISQFN